MNVDEIMKVLPHRYPFLLVDGVLEIKEDRIKAFKNISISDPVFQGHFPSYPIYPGVLILEGMAQSAGILLLREIDGVPLFLGVDNARFKKEVRPGDRLVYEVEVLRKRSNFVKVKCSAYVDGELVASAELLLGVKK